MAFIKVDFPQPLGPMIVTTSPMPTVIDTPCSISVSPYPATTPQASSSVTG